jgi:hypothetical protein
LPSHDSCIFLREERERGYLDQHNHQSISPLCEGNLFDTDLGVLYGFWSLFFSSYSSIAFVVLMGFGREGFEHFVCSCSCIWCIGLSSPQRFG